MNRISLPSDTHALEARLAARLTAALSARSESVPRDIAERLRVAREQAVERARQVRVVARATPGGAAVVGVSAGNAALLGGFRPWWQRAAAVLPLVLLVAGLIAIDRWTLREQMLTAADIDAQLLSDTLPPAAYSDPGFAEYLRTAPPQ